jgi:signal transduction histidine kinase
VSVPPALTVIADADRIAQAVDNLVGNALRHGAAPVTVTARAAGENRVEIVVRDAGPGVAQELRGRLFERFATGGRRRGGTGLGLFIVRELARAHGGDAWYDEGDGFVLSLPAGWPA